MSAHPNPPKLPAGSIGFLATRHDQPERRALYFPGGGLCCSFGAHAMIARIELALANDGVRLGAMLAAPVSACSGGVWAVRR